MLKVVYSVQNAALSMKNLRVSTIKIFIRYYIYIFSLKLTNTFQRFAFYILLAFEFKITVILCKIVTPLFILLLYGVSWFGKIGLAERVTYDEIKIELNLEMFEWWKNSLN